MNVMPVNITDRQKEILAKRKADTHVPISAQIREAIDLYIENLDGDEK